MAKYQSNNTNNVYKPKKSAEKVFSNTNDDLVTIKNTDDYNNFLMKRENDTNHSKGMSTLRFEKQILNQLQRDSSIEGNNSGFHSGFTGRTGGIGNVFSDREMGDHSA